MIKHVSDTSAWVAYYRAVESERKDAIFKDPYAKILLGDSAVSFAKDKSNINKWTSWTVVMRTYIIDQMLRELISGGVTVFVNLGAGLDSRPYRMNLESNIVWIEVDFPDLIKEKDAKLAEFNPSCQLKRMALDLSHRDERVKFFEHLSAQYKNIVVLTEGVLPYLTIDQVSELSEDLNRFSSFCYWICEYISPKSYHVLKDRKEMKALSQSPFQFFPEDWLGFFHSRGWRLTEEKYYVDISEKFKRETPFPKIFKIMSYILGEKWSLPYRRICGYLLWEK